MKPNTPRLCGVKPPRSPKVGGRLNEVWPRIFQNLRASCATDWVERYPSHVVAKWLGHSPKVAAQRYLMSKDRHFEDVVGGGRGEPLTGEGGQGGVPNWSAKCDAIETRNATPQAPASAGREPQKKTEPAATIQVAAGSSKLASVTKTGQRHDAAQKKSRQGPWMAGRGRGAARRRAKKQPAGAMDGPGVDEERHDAAQKNSPPGPWMARRA